MAAFLEKSTGSEGFHQVIDFLSQSHISYALTKKPDIYISFIKQFWRTAEASTDTDGEIFEQLALMGYQPDSDNPKKTAWEQFSSNIATALICLATNRKFNFSRLIFEHMVTNIGSPHKFLMYPRFIQICLDMQKKQLKTHSKTYLVPSLNNKVFSNMRRLTKGYTGVEIGLFPTMLPSPPPEPSPTLSSSPSRITSSPSPSSEPSTAPTFEPQPSPDAEYPVPTPNESPLHAVHSLGSDEGSGSQNSIHDEVVHDQDTAEEGQPEDSTAGITVSIAPINISTARETSSTAARVVYGRRSKEARKDKGKAIMNEPEAVKRSKKLLQQERQGLEEAIRLQKEVDDEKKAQIARDEEIARQLLALDEERVTTKTKTTKDIDWNDPLVQKTRSSTKKQKVELDDEKEDLKGYLNIVPKEDVVVDVDFLSTKYPIVDWKTYTLSENFMYYKNHQRRWKVKELQDFE
ncbi:hypothetical protein Tco_0315983 [Tanacetum coccineum]